MATPAVVRDLGEQLSRLHTIWPEDLGEAAHADPSDADEVNVPDATAEHDYEISLSRRARRPVGSWKMKSAISA